MNKLVSSILMLLLFIISCAQSVKAQEKFNLDFEKNADAKEMPDKWYKWGTFETTKDTISYTGTYAGKIISNGNSDSFGCITYTIPVNFDGKTIRLEGYMKTENVVGYSGLLLRVDGNGRMLDFDNMKDHKI